jgi:hypothetical protein
MNNCCVLWSRETNRLHIATHDEAANLNMVSFLDNRPALAVIRERCTEEDARRFVRSYAALMATRFAGALEHGGSMTTEEQRAAWREQFHRMKKLRAGEVEPMRKGPPIGFKKDGIRRHILERSAGPDGFDVHDKPVWPVVRLQEQCRALKFKGHLFRAGAKTLTRYFVNEEHAKAYAVKYAAKMRAQEKAREVAETKRRSAKKKAAKAAKPKPLPKPKKPARAVTVVVKHYGTARWDKDAPPIITSETKVTICASPPAYGIAARMLHVPVRQLTNQLPALKAGADL